eukprot:TRINITY_DN21969_c0_g1_i1.p1 TRINITY_DN21969_c0_g1~~TRINITY_DN21969_c0_g1_i1.p1  ORF type:complete len:431 (+),score=44.56 TRINITY_DN21969_c0_g1_i1:44-1336(+)
MATAKWTEWTEERLQRVTPFVNLSDLSYLPRFPEGLLRPLYRPTALWNEEPLDLEQRTTEISNNFLSLPGEVITTKIIPFLDVQTVLDIPLVCSVLYHLIFHDQQLWRSLYIKTVDELNKARMEEEPAKKKEFQSDYGPRWAEYTHLVPEEVIERDDKSSNPFQPTWLKPWRRRCLLLTLEPVDTIRTVNNTMEVWQNIADNPQYQQILIFNFNTAQGCVVMWDSGHCVEYSDSDSDEEEKRKRKARRQELTQQYIRAHTKACDDPSKKVHWKDVKGFLGQGLTRHELKGPFANAPWPPMCSTPDQALSCEIECRCWVYQYQKSTWKMVGWGDLHGSEQNQYSLPLSLRVARAVYSQAELHASHTKWQTHGCGLPIDCVLALEHDDVPEWEDKDLDWYTQPSSGSGCVVGWEFFDNDSDVEAVDLERLKQ